MESLGNIGALVGGLGVLVSAIFVGVQIRVANKLARADSQRHTRHAWQEALCKSSDDLGPLASNTKGDICSIASA